MTLEPGDHLWYWDGRISQGTNIPQAEWFPGFNGATDYLGNGKDIYNFVVYESEIVRGRPQMNGFEGSFAWLNNNPGNITGPTFDMGQYPGKFNWHNFLIFPTWDAGFTAIALLMRSPSYASLSLTAALQRYAPAGDGGNDPVRYAQDVADAVGRDPSYIVGDLDENEMVVLQNKIMEIEGAVGGNTYALDSSDLPDAVREALA